MPDFPDIAPPSITNIFNERLKRDMPVIQEMFAAYFDAQAQAAEWDDLAVTHWNAILARVTTLVTQALHDDPTAVDKMKAWSKESGIEISFHVDKIKSRLPHVIAMSIVNGMAAFADGLIEAVDSVDEVASEAPAEPPPEQPGPKAV